VREEMLGGSLDVSPTLLGLVGRPYRTLFFGRDLLKSQSGEGRAPVNHNRDIGMFRHDRLTVLGLMQSAEIYDGAPNSGEMKLISGAPSPLEIELQKDVTAFYQVADDLYINRRYAQDKTANPGPMP